jgi:hypothetical protein
MRASQTAAIAILSVALVACSNRDVFAPNEAPVTTSSHVLGESSPTVRNIAATYKGEGDDSVLRRAVYVITFEQSKSSLTALIAIASKKGTLQTNLKGKVTTHGYALNAYGTCKGTVKGRVAPDGSKVSGLYSALTCGGVRHSGSFGADKVPHGENAKIVPSPRPPLLVVP